MNISYHDAKHILDLQDSNPTQKLLLFAMLTHMHPGTKRIHPSYATLSKELGCDKRTVMRNMKALTEDGLLQIRKEEFAGRNCNMYVVPFSDGYAYKSEQNDPSLPRPDLKPKGTETSDARREPDNEAWMEACRKTVYSTPIPSVFVDVMFEDIRQMGFVDASGKRITPRTLQSHIARMWKHSGEKTFFVTLEKMWDKYWQNYNDGLYTDKNGNRDVRKEDAAIARLETEYGIDWGNTDKEDEMHAPLLGFNPLYRYYPDKSQKRKANHVRNLPIGI